MHILPVLLIGQGSGLFLLLQLKHDVEPLLTEYVPGGHTSHGSTPVTENIPGEHCCVS